MLIKIHTLCENEQQRTKIKNYIFVPSSLFPDINGWACSLFSAYFIFEMTNDSQIFLTY